MKPHISTDAARALVALGEMTQTIWDSLTEEQRAAARSTKRLTPQLIGLEGQRVEVRIGHKTYRFVVGRSTGWEPVHVERYRVRARDGLTAEMHYDSVEVVNPHPAGRL